MFQNCSSSQATTSIDTSHTTEMVNKKDSRAKSFNNKIGKSKKKPTSNNLSKSKSKSKSTKNKIDKLNRDISEINEVQTLLAATGSDKTKTTKSKALDSIKEDLKKDEDLKQKNTLAEKDLNKQLELLTEMGL